MNCKLVSKNMLSKGLQKNKGYFTYIKFVFTDKFHLNQYTVNTSFRVFHLLRVIFES